MVGGGEEQRDSQPQSVHVRGAGAFVVITATIALILGGIAAFLFYSERTQSEGTAPATTGASASSTVRSEPTGSTAPPTTTAGSTPTSSAARVGASLLPPLPGYTDEEIEDLDGLRSGLAEDLATRPGYDLLAARSVEGNRVPVLVYVIGPRSTPGATRPFGTCRDPDTVTLGGQIVCEQFLAPFWILSWVAGDYIIRSAADDRLAAEEVMAALIAANGG